MNGIWLVGPSPRERSFKIEIGIFQHSRMVKFYLYMCTYTHSISRHIYINTVPVQICKQRQKTCTNLLFGCGYISYQPINSPKKLLEKFSINFPPKQKNVDTSTSASLTHVSTLPPSFHQSAFDFDKATWRDQSCSQSKWCSNRSQSWGGNTHWLVKHQLVTIGTPKKPPKLLQLFWGANDSNFACNCICLIPSMGISKIITAIRNTNTISPSNKNHVIVLNFYHFQKAQSSGIMWDHFTGPWSAYHAKYF